MQRPKTSQKVIDEFTKIIDSQDAKGLEKYGVTIDEANGYNWSLMALEETADLQKYLVKRIEELEIILEGTQKGIERYGKALQKIYSTVQLTESEIDSKTALRNIENIVIESW
ncbi:hypothetical protein QNH20_19280 [Neobacillus sp. WH10]|uniref:hypothetical protein n=1 Tax=Neobacillus sp. WH10 TaxID=3047873 RepID=UPI0024C138CA|nr:hypothetical protein [Neobacillus sp. WH10]WHY76249.1 hypothetical protein QNH20_19280 [Neobacillus sp. WH10]